MTRKNEKIRRRQIAWEFPVYHDPLISASRYVMRETEDMFQSIYVDIKEYWGGIFTEPRQYVYMLCLTEKCTDHTAYASMRRISTICAKEVFHQNSIVGQY